MDLSRKDLCGLREQDTAAAAAERTLRSSDEQRYGRRNYRALRLLKSYQILRSIVALAAIVVDHRPLTAPAANDRADHTRVSDGFLGAFSYSSGIHHHLILNTELEPRVRPQIQPVDLRKSQRLLVPIKHQRLDSAGVGLIGEDRNVTQPNYHNYDCSSNIGSLQ